MSSETRDIVFIEKIDGRDKPVYHKQGILVIKDGDFDKISIKLNSIPVGPSFNGWLNVIKPKKKDSAPPEPTEKNPF